jgi:hypothetical protein
MGESSGGSGMSWEKGLVGCIAGKKYCKWPREYAIYPNIDYIVSLALAISSCEWR